MATLAEILALFPDNTTGAIDADDMRTAITEIWGRTAGTIPIEGLLFDTNGLDTGIAGHVHWESDVNTLGLEVSATGSLQVGQEQYVIGRNTTGSTILDGRAVQITGGQGNSTLVSLDDGEGDVIGLATEDIANNSNGRVTTFGIVHNLNTSAFTDGARVYATATGTLSTAVSASFVGVVLNAATTGGSILVFPSSPPHAAGTTAQRPVARPIGFRFYDTTLGIPVWWNGAAWANASGVVV